MTEGRPFPEGLAGSRRSELSLAVGIPATGGYVTRERGDLWFVPDPETIEKLKAAGLVVQDRVKTRVTFCNPTPGTVPALGDYVDPDTGLVCFLELPEGWSHAWMWGDVPKSVGFPTYTEWWEALGREAGLPYDPPFSELPAEAPYFVEYWGPDTGHERKNAGPFDTPEEAFDYGLARYGGMAPSVGHIEVMDTLHRVVIIT